MSMKSTTPTIRRGSAANRWKTYLNLYVNFKLKVKEAEALHLDTTANLRTQLEQYHQQLAQSFLRDKEVNEALLREAHDRLSKEVRTQHILINVAEDAPPADTLTAYNKAMEVYNKITRERKDFTEMARQYSQDPSVTDNGGELGYLTAFQTVYPFESAAYTTPVGTVSKPVRTKFGYHLVKVLDVRNARGKVQVAHILVKSSIKDPAEKQDEARKRIEDFYAQATQPNGNFNTLARSSEDRELAAKGGELPMFGSGRMLPEFEEAAFALKEVGDISKPFQTKLGWHIVKLMKREPVGSYEFMKADLKKRVERDTRSRMSPLLFVNRLKKDYAYSENTTALKNFTTKVDTSVLKGNWKVVNLQNPTAVLFSATLPDKTRRDFTLQQFASYVENNQGKIRGAQTTDAAVSKLYSTYVEEQLSKLEEAQLEKKNPEFARLIQEFRDGNLLYELMGVRVWNKAMQDFCGPGKVPRKPQKQVYVERARRCHHHYDAQRAVENDAKENCQIGC